MAPGGSTGQAQPALAGLAGAAGLAGSPEEFREARFCAQWRYFRHMCLESEYPEGTVDTFPENIHNRRLDLVHRCRSLDTCARTVNNAMLDFVHCLQYFRNISYTH